MDSDGNRVNVGNFDSDGLNVNNNWDDNHNDNIGAASARKSPPLFAESPPYGRAFSYRPLAVLIHPPS